MKRLLISILLCFCLITPAIAAKHYNNNGWRSMPFIEMMVTMMKVMNQILGGSNSFTGMNTLAYSPAFMPGMANGMNGLGAFNSFPMSPGGVNALPLNSMVNPLLNSFQTGQNTTPYGANMGTTRQTPYPPGSANNDFWDPDSQNSDSSIAVVANNSLNGIWQALTGDVIAIYNDNRFLWSDGGSRNIAGHLAIKGNNMIAYVPARNITLYFQFYMEPGQFIVRDKSARIYTFKRIH